MLEPLDDNDLRLINSAITRLDSWPKAFSDASNLRKSDIRKRDIDEKLTAKAVPLCKTSTFQSSYFNRILPLWNRMCISAKPSDISSLTMFRSFLSRTYLHLFISCYYVDMACTWSLHRTCSCHRVGCCGISIYR